MKECLHDEELTNEKCSICLEERTGNKSASVTGLCAKDVNVEFQILVIKFLISIFDEVERVDGTPVEDLYDTGRKFIKQREEHLKKSA